MTEQAKKTISDPIVLETPIARDGGDLTELRLRRPKAGELRGISHARLSISDVDEVLRLLPRITLPPITDAEAAELDPADFTEICGEIADFLFTARRKAELQTA